MDVVRFIFPAMRAATFGAFFFLTLAGCGQSESGIAENKVEKPFAACEGRTLPNQFIVHWKNGAITQEYAADRETLIKDVIEPNNDEITFAEHDLIVKIQNPVVHKDLNTSFFNDVQDPDRPVWGLLSSSAASAWNRGIRGQGVIVAVIDSGADTEHTQLRSRLAINPDETPNGIDDDGNGLVDDLHGWDFANESGLVTDDSGHGTHVAGIVVADHSSGPVQGTAPEALLLPLDFMNQVGEGTVFNAVRAMRYAVSRGAKVINASWGGEHCSRSLQEAIVEVTSQGVLFVSASGNGNRHRIAVNIENFPAFPAAFGIPGQITVGAVTRSNRMAGFSNFSSRLVHLLAPGVDIFSTYPGNRTAYQQGTSMATPFVSGAAALLWSHRPQASASEVRQAILNSVDVSPGYTVVTQGRLNIEKALAELTRLIP